ncbi:MAG: hypothetical protein LBI01_04435 [Elusimicrobium sp.]|nr:hypothetical protein [Elusimicrobium sp.]
MHKKAAPAPEVKAKVRADDAYAAFHKDFIKCRITLIGCPKLDGAYYSEKLSEIIKRNDIQNVAAANMEAPCCESRVI